MSATTSHTSTSAGEVSRLLTAAVINQRFCRLLLTNPASALANGYNGESFRLANEEKELILSIRAKSLADFARQISNQPGGNSCGHYGVERRSKAIASPSRMVAAPYA